MINDDDDDVDDYRVFISGKIVGRKLNDKFSLQE